MSVLIVSNAATPRARRQIAALRDALPEQAALSHRVTEHAAELDALLGHDRWQPGDLLVINGGDGSVQHALSLLASHCPEQRWPAIACLPGGSTNMTAFDLNAHRRYGDCAATLVGLIRRHAEPLPAPRPVVRVSSGADSGTVVRCGLFFGIGTIVQGVEYFQTRLKTRLQGDARHELAAGAALARALWGIARGQPPFDEPLCARVTASGVDAPPLTGAAMSLRLLLTTTLERLFLGMRPYWGSGPGALKTTLVESGAERFLRRIPRLLRGRPDPGMTPAAGYCSGRYDTLTLRFSGSYTLDGELFPSAGDTMALSTTAPVRFVPL